MFHAQSSHRRIIGLIATSLLFAATSSLDLGAQSTFATLTGTVTDSSSAVVPGATVTAVNVNTAAERAAITDETGRYQMQNLDAGPYRITVSLTGFRDQMREADLLARQTVRVDVQIVVAGTTETVQVVAATPIIETDRATLDTSKSGDDINRLALNFRATNNTSPIVVATLAPAVQQDRSGAISIAGNLPFMTSFSVDGISTQRTRGGGPSRDLSVGGVDCGIQGQRGEQQRGIHPGHRPDHHHQGWHQRVARHRLLVPAGQQVHRHQSLHATRRERHSDQTQSSVEEFWRFSRRTDRAEQDLLFRDL